MRKKIETSVCTEMEKCCDLHLYLHLLEMRLQQEYTLFYKNNDFQAKTGVFLFYCRFEVEIFL